MATAKSLIKSLLPQALIEAWRNSVRAREQRRNSGMTTEEVFTEIYARNKWGGAAGTFFSGDGTADDQVVAPYVARVQAWLREVGAETMTLVDLGCGDFEVGRQLAGLGARYVGVDIVKSMIASHTATFGSPRIEFRHVDIIEDPLPDGDICFVRQVMQHLSNAQIARILPKLSKYRWVVVTEHQPTGMSRQPNLDKPHGSGIRIFEGSGVYLDEPPFSIPRDRLRTLLEVKGHGFGSAMDPGFIRTVVLTNP